MINATKYHSNDLNNFCAICEAQNADNARMLEYELTTNYTGSLCNKRLQHRQKMTVVFVINTYTAVHLPET